MFLCPAVNSGKGWAQYSPSDPVVVGNKGAMVIQVLSGRCRIILYGNSVGKSEYIRKHREDIKGVLTFAQKFLRPEDEDHFAERQVCRANVKEWANVQQIT